MKFTITVASITGQIKFMTDVDTVIDTSEGKTIHESTVSGVATDIYIRSALLAAASVDVGNDFFDDGELKNGTDTPITNL
jgi:hypothetical protein